LLTLTGDHSPRDHWGHLSVPHVLNTIFSLPLQDTSSRGSPLSFTQRASLCWTPDPQLLEHYTLKTNKNRAWLTIIIFASKYVNIFVRKIEENYEKYKPYNVYTLNATFKRIEQKYNHNAFRGNENYGIFEKTPLKIVYIYI